MAAPHGGGGRCFRDALHKRIWVSGAQKTSFRDNFLADTLIEVLVLAGTMRYSLSTAL
jgi:hypothetical protein